MHRYRTTDPFSCQYLFHFNSDSHFSAEQMLFIDQKGIFNSKVYNIYIINTIIFSKRASISFSEVIFEESSSNGFVVDDELMDQSLALCLK